jgi:hypothetical protein
MTPGTGAPSFASTTRPRMMPVGVVAAFCCGDAGTCAARPTTRAVVTICIARCRIVNSGVEMIRRVEGSPARSSPVSPPSSA